MPYKENPFKEGDVVECIKDCPSVVHRSTCPENVGTVAATFPKKGDVLVVDEVLGEYLRFSEHDEPDSFHWWIHTHFRPANIDHNSEHWEDSSHLELEELLTTAGVK